jgi:hypothetical protein
MATVDMIFKLNQFDININRLKVLIKHSNISLDSTHDQTVLELNNQLDLKKVYFESIFTPKYDFTYLTN